ncbi:MAG: HD domain-containing phosphohydrolase [Spirochaetia bacterium]
MLADTVLIVDDDEAVRTMLQSALETEYSVKTASDGSEGLAKSEEEPIPDLIILDLNMPGKDGMEVIKELHMVKRTRSIPVLFLTGQGEDSTEKRGFDSGAVDFLRKPVSPAVLKARISRHIKDKKNREQLELLVIERTGEIKATQMEIIYRLGRAAEYKDNETGEHIKRISAYSSRLAHSAGFSSDFCDLLYSASPMHDVGKIGIPDAILTKPGPLTEPEWEIMKSHTLIGAELMGGSQSQLLKTAAIIALSHHEKWEGTGYPKQLAGKNIPVEGRIVALCDVYDALISKRPYKEPWSPERAREEIAKGGGSHFDPVLADIFLEKFDYITG